MSGQAIEAAIAAFDVWEPQLRAFAWFDREQVRAAAAAPRRGSLAGLPIGVKDIIDTAGIPTEYGTPIFAGRRAARNAVAVDRIEAAGAIVFGKTVTAELAYYEPGPTTNPWNPTRTPGGSSMGSAAAVAAGVVPAALGTQTNGSLIRPAAFSGTVAFKPSAGSLPTGGVLSFSPSLDQVGAFGRDVETAVRVCSVLAGDRPAIWLAPEESVTAPRIGLVRTPEWDLLSSVMRSRIDEVADVIETAGGSVRELSMPAALAEAIAAHRTIMAVEANRSLRTMLAGELSRCSTQFRELLDAGAGTPEHAYKAARVDQRAASDAFATWTGEVDALLTPATLGEAPPIETTGDPVCCTRWTLVGAPVFSIPCGLTPDVLPLGVQLVGHHGRDRELAGIARWLELILGRLRTPTPPRSAEAHA